MEEIKINISEFKNGIIEMFNIDYACLALFYQGEELEMAQKLNNLYKDFVIGILDNEENKIKNVNK